MVAKKPPKLPNVGPLIRQCAAAGDVLFLAHAILRQGQREITRLEAVTVLLTGRYTPARDRWSDEHQAWSYAVEGQTDEARRLRVIVAFEDGMVVVTLIDLDTEE